MLNSELVGLRIRSLSRLSSSRNCSWNWIVSSRVAIADGGGGWKDPSAMFAPKRSGGDAECSACKVAFHSKLNSPSLAPRWSDGHNVTMTSFLVPPIRGFYSRQGNSFFCLPERSRQLLLLRPHAWPHRARCSLELAIPVFLVKYFRLRFLFGTVSRTRRTLVASNYEHCSTSILNHSDSA